jgi:amino acid adenylation domain-containing protein
MLPAPLPELDPLRAGDPRPNIADQFTRQAASTPETVAVISRGRHLTYRELEERSNQVASYLRSLGVQPETLVGVSVPRNEMLVVTLLAILKAGGAYVPLDPAYPQERLALFIADSGMRILVAAAESQAALPPGLPNLTVVNVDDPIIAKQSKYPIHSEIAGNNLAYVMYTSGSTGTPKGVMVEHRNVINFFAGMDRAIGCNIGVWLAVTSVAFDISVLELLWTLTRGFTIVLHKDGDASIADQMARHNVTHLQMTPSLARMLTLDARAFTALGSLKQILLGGEAVPASLVTRIREVFKGDIYNMYGPTETTIWSTTYRIEEVTNPIPIGWPILNTEVFLLDAELNPAADGEIAELYIGGHSVARGYWKRPDLTADRFLNLPSLSPHPIYRTGDLARLLSNGELEFLGRVDQQIKLRGHRIEPGEIEAQLERCPGVDEAVVILREDKQGDPRLVAYVTTKLPVPPTAATLKDALARNLPEVMIPSAFHFLSAMPLNQNGKVDRRALLQIAAPAIPFPAPALRSEPESELQRVVATAWKNALGAPTIGLHDNFFDLGAHSLNVAEVHAALENALGRAIPLLDLYEYSTVSSLSRHLAGIAPSGAASVASARAQLRKQARSR